MARTVESENNVAPTTRPLSARGMRTSIVFHAGVLAALMLIPAQAMSRPLRAKKELNVAFYRAPLPEPPARKIPLPPSLDGGASRQVPGVALPAPRAQEARVPAPEDPGKPELPTGPEEGVPLAQEPPRRNIGSAGILAFKDKFASLSQDKLAPRLGADARYTDADEVGQATSRSMLTTNTPGGSGGINTASLNRNVGGGGGGTGGNGFNRDGAGGSGGSGMPGLPVGKASSPIAGIGGGERPLARNGPGPSRTDEEIQIVFDRYKASFYRLYNKELRNDPTLKGQMVLRLTIEPDGSVSMCVLQSTDMHAPDLSTQVVNRVRTINFGPKEGVPALTIVYPIDFLPAA